MFSSITIKFQTAPATPPPFSHFYTIGLQASANNTLKVSFELVYTDRVGFDPDEIEAEGFSQNDDYAWAGQLSNVWAAELERLLGVTKSFAPVEEKDAEDYLEVEVVAPNTAQAGLPNNAAAWQYVGQELVQAIYETAGRERPFEIALLRISDGRRVSTKYVAAFASRQFTKITTANAKTLPEKQPWEALESAMKTIYTPDYITEEAIEKPPVRDGLYVQQPDGLWYELRVAVVEPPGGSNTLGALQKMFA